MSQVRHAIGQHWRILSLILVVILFFWIVWILRSALFPFMIGLAIVYIILPIIRWIEARLPRQDKLRQVKRASLIILIFFFIIVLLASFGFYIFTVVVTAASELARTAPNIFNAAQAAIQDWVQRFLMQLPPSFQTQLNQAVQNFVAQIGTILTSALRASLTVIPTTFGFFAGLATLPIFVFYTLKDWEMLRNRFYSFLPSWSVQHIRSVIIIIGLVLGGYVRATLLLGLTVGLMALIALLVLGVPFAPALAAIAGVTEIVPVLGPWIGGIIIVVVTLALDPPKVLWVIVAFAIIQLSENNLLVPRIQGQLLNVHPSIAIVLLVLGSYIGGFWGIVLAVPLAATGAAIYRYFTHATRAEDITGPTS